MSIGGEHRHLTAQVGEAAATLEIDYAIEIDHTVAGRNVFQIKIKEAAPGCSLEAVAWSISIAGAGAHRRRDRLPPENQRARDPAAGRPRWAITTTVAGQKCISDQDQGGGTGR